jgi:hypothetical protein
MHDAIESHTAVKWSVLLLRIWKVAHSILGSGGRICRLKLLILFLRSSRQMVGHCFKKKAPIFPSKYVPIHHAQSPWHSTLPKPKSKNAKLNELGSVSLAVFVMLVHLLHSLFSVLVGVYRSDSREEYNESYLVIYISVLNEARARLTG